MAPTAEWQRWLGLLGWLVDRVLLRKMILDTLGFCQDINQSIFLSLGIECNDVDPGGFQVTSQTNYFLPLFEPQSIKNVSPSDDEVVCV